MTALSVSVSATCVMGTASMARKKRLARGAARRIPVSFAIIFSAHEHR